MKKIFISLFFVFLLSSCFSSSSTTDTSTLTDFSGSGFTVSVPKTWSVIDNKSKTLPSPKDSFIVLAASSSEVKYGFANNMLVLEANLAKSTDSKTYSDLNNIGSSKTYKNYLKLDKKDFTFTDGVISSLYVFQAKYNETTPNLKFIQTAHLCNDKAYLITVALNIDIKDTSKYEDMLKTFKCN